MRSVPFNPRREHPVSHMRRPSRVLVRVRRVDPDKSIGRTKQLAHVSIKDVILDKVVDHVQREHQIRSLVTYVPELSE